MSENISYNDFQLITLEFHNNFKEWYGSPETDANMLPLFHWKPQYDTVYNEISEMKKFGERAFYGMQLDKFLDYLDDIKYYMDFVKDHNAKIIQ